MNTFKACSKLQHKYNLLINSVKKMQIDFQKYFFFFKPSQIINNAFVDKCLQILISSEYFLLKYYVFLRNYKRLSRVIKVIKGFQEL